MSASNASGSDKIEKKVFAPSLEKAIKVINKLIGGFVDEHDLAELLNEKNVSFGDDSFQKKLEKSLKKFFQNDQTDEDDGKKGKKGKKEKKEKKNKDMNAPKKSKTSYIFFCQDKRKEVKEANPEIKETNVTVELGKMWKLISPSSKKKYEEMSSTDKSRYETEMKSYTKPSSEELAQAAESSKKKRGISGYIYFCKITRNQVKESNKEFSSKEITKELGRLWTDLTKEEKEDYNSKAKQFNAENTKSVSEEEEKKTKNEEDEEEKKTKNTKKTKNEDDEEEKKTKKTTKKVKTVKEDEEEEKKSNTVNEDEEKKSSKKKVKKVKTVKEDEEEEEKSSKKTSKKEKNTKTEKKSSKKEEQKEEKKTKTKKSLQTKKSSKKEETNEDEEDL
jgi:hypothetical protein